MPEIAEKEAITSSVARGHLPLGLWTSALCPRACRRRLLLREMTGTSWTGPCRGGDCLRQNASDHPVLKHGPRSLTYVRVLGWQTPGRSESKCGAPAADHFPSRSRFECEHTCWDPKDGELCLNRSKPGETLVEARSGSDVQIDRQIWV